MPASFHVCDYGLYSRGYFSAKDPHYSQIIQDQDYQNLAQLFKFNLKLDTFSYMTLKLNDGNGSISVTSGKD